MQKYTTYDDLHATGPDGAYCGLLADERDVYLASEADAEHSELIAHNVEAHARIAELERELSVARDEITDLRAFIGMVKNHVYYAAKAYGLTS